MPDTRSYAVRKARESETYGTDEAIQRRIRARVLGLLLEDERRAHGA